MKLSCFLLLIGKVFQVPMRGVSTLINSESIEYLFSTSEGLRGSYH